MLRRSLPVLLAALLAVALAVPAYAGEKIEGDGYSIRLPDGFKEAMSIEGNGQFKVNSRFGDLPVDGMPEMKIFTFGPDDEPRGVIMVARVNLTRSISTSEELGMKDLEAARARLPEGMTLTARKIGDYDAVEMTMTNDMMDEEQLVNVLSVACGDYVIVVTFMSMDGSFRTPDLMWASMVSSLEIKPGVNKVLLFGGIGFGALVLIMFLKRLGSRDVGTVYAPKPSYGVGQRSGHYDYGGEDSAYTAPADPEPVGADDDAQAPDPGFLRDPAPLPGRPLEPTPFGGGAADPASRPRTLPSSPRTLPSSPASPRTLPSSPGSARTMPSSPASPASPRTPPSPPATPARPPSVPVPSLGSNGQPKPPERKGLRPTLPASGRWEK